MLPGPTFIDQLEKLKKAYGSIRINLIERDPMSIEDLSAVDPFSYDNVIILSQSERIGSYEKMDSETLFILLLLRKIFRDRTIKDKKTKLITQVLKSENQELITQTNVDDFLISNKLITRILARISKEANIKHVYDNLFKESGSEIFLKPASLYFNSFPMEATFADMIGIAQKRKEICIGVRLTGYATSPEKNFGITLNPNKNTHYVLNTEETLVVMAEDEL